MSLIGTTILIVEDNDAQYRDVRKVLLDNQPDGIAVQYILQRVETLVDTLKYISGGYDIILLDLNLPDSMGFKTFEDVKVLADKHYDIPIIVTTVLEDVKIGLECYKAGAADYLIKSWLNGNPLLLHFMVLKAIEINRQAQKLRSLMAERIGKNRPLIQRCKACEQRIGCSRWRAESDGEWMLPDQYIESIAINFTDGVCAECFDIIYRPQIQ